MRKQLLLAVALFVSTTVAFAQQGKHPAYLHALSDLRAARWMIEHRPGNWQQTEDEIAAVKKIDEAINEIKKASIDDGKDINDHPNVDEKPDHMGRLHKAVDFLNKAKEDINKEEDKSVAQDLRAKANNKIEEAIKITQKAIHQ
jgi:tetratricopeptide (TPR) repeat protein